ncbi:hypothetical protein [Cupriavidus neocaledonicus]|uniref:Lipoprotein n=1 Tax=Cupriavidus neocaledonicus TaxID=1040979 RepID=A0A375H900_9BURK|nr:hypothetical protein [Cupriavidus neocaledonicus]SPD46707.1 conserved protein of unknown function [Cupriavidus neocaledonicus]
MNKTLKLAAAYIGVTLMLAGCGKPQDAVIPNDMSTWDKDLAPKIQKLSDEDKKLLTGYLMRAKMGEAFGGKGVPIGTTVGQGIEEQKKWVAEQEAKAAEEKALKEKIERERAAAAEAIGKAVTVALIEKKELASNYRAGRYGEEQVFKIAVKNNSEKEIAGVSGELEFIDVFDKTVGSVTFSISEKIKAGAEYVWVGSRRYNQFIDSQRAVWNLEDGKYKTRFKPETVVFADGAKLGSPQ